MHLFPKKFEPKPTPARASRCNIGRSAVKEDLNDFKSISLTLENKQLRFVDGDWIQVSKKGEGSSASSSEDNLAKLAKSVKSLENENKLHEVKLDILLDLLTENMVQGM